MKQGALKLGVFAGPLMGTLFFIAMWPLMHIFPPYSPMLTADAVAQHVAENRTGFLVGGILLMTAASIVWPFITVILLFLRKIEGELAMWTIVTGLVFTFGQFTVFLCGLAFTMAAFRPDASVEAVRMWADLGMFLLVIPAIPGTTQYLATGAVILQDKRARPILPRWYGYLNIWVGILSAPGAVVGLFKVGPFAWNGIAAFWIPAVVFGVWITATQFTLLAAIKRNAIMDTQ
ncbi:hypothetical protein [Novosphingobium sp. CCH12-A3]|uniref:hypothetical protein n=1 Tax=Novosphingobium sp. CCH12-A3 TaxID=1768752 RepID=UPI000780849D|nr:hypothetical protein [Novosphingobium sp. CCH12-A3]